MDLYYKYDGSSETDYEVKVEVVHLDEKTEKEQMTYMAVGNTKADIVLIADYIGDIDYTDLGLSETEISDILSLTGTENILLDSLDDLLSTDVAPSDVSQNATPQEKKAHIKDVKQHVKEAARERQTNEEAYVTLSFSTFQAKSDFCDLIGCSTDDKFVKGEDVLKLIE